jgi:hypothetical protein
MPPTLDYMIDLPCDPKRRFGREGLWERVRSLDPTRSAGDALRALESGFELRPVAFHCVRCPANRSRREFACEGALPLPLSAEGERWLAGLLPVSLRERDAESPAQTRQIRAAHDLARRLPELAVSGADCEQGFRGAGLLEAPHPTVRQYGWLWRPTRLTSSQLLELLLLRGRVEPAPAEAVCRALGVWHDGDRTADGVPEVVFTQPVESADEPSVAGLKRFLLALMIAASLDVPLLTSLHG